MSELDIIIEDGNVRIIIYVHLYTEPFFHSSLNLCEKKCPFLSA